MIGAEALTEHGCIQSMHFGGVEPGSFSVGVGGVTAITVEMVNGSMAPAPWLLVREGKRVTSTWNAAAIEGVVFMDKTKA